MGDQYVYVVLYPKSNKYEGKLHLTLDEARNEAKDETKKIDSGIFLAVKRTANGEYSTQEYGYADDFIRDTELVLS